jgi:YtkA-like
VQVDVRWSPQDPVVGVDAGEFTVKDANGAPINGLTLTVVPWMPAHGHGTAVKPVITETSPGIFVATRLYLYMSGHWDLRTTIGGADGDTATPDVDLP